MSFNFVISGRGTVAVLTLDRFIRSCDKLSAAMRPLATGLPQHFVVAVAAAAAAAAAVFRYVTMRNAILTCAQKLTRVSLIYRTEPTTKKWRRKGRLRWEGCLRNRPHNRQLPDRISRITDCNFTVRMLYRNMYRLLCILDLRFVLFLCTTAI